MGDILWKTGDRVFSYRVAGILIRDGKVLLQKPSNDPGYAFPGGHVSFGETQEETLNREFREELGAEIRVGDLIWVGELFFPWGSRTCQQICLYYRVELTDSSDLPLSDFPGKEQLEGRDFTMEFHWIPLSEVGKYEIYPPRAVRFLTAPEDGVRHFVYREE